MTGRLRRWQEVLSRSAFFANTLALISGTVITQAIVFLASPILSRVFGLEAFGNLANYNAWVAILALLSNFRYEHGILVARGRKHTSRALALTMLLSTGSFMVYSALAVALYVWGPRSGYLANLRSIAPLIPPGTLAVCVASALMQLNVKQGQFQRLALLGAAQVVCTLGAQLILGHLQVPHALIVGTIVGFVVAGVAFGWLFATEGQVADVRNGLRLAHLHATARAHRNFPRYALGADAITVVAQQFIPVFVLALFNPAVAGLYAFSIRVVRVPMIVISTAVAGALRKEAIDRVHGGRGLRRLFIMTTRTMALLSIVPFVVVLLFARPIFAVVFGQQWADAGRVVQILSPGILLEFIALPLTVFFLVTDTQRYTLAIQIAGFVLLVGALAVGKWYFHDFIGTCYLMSAVMFCVNLVSIALAGRVAGASPAPVAVAA